MSKHKIDYEMLSKDVVEFTEYFYNIQTIFPNLFDDIELNIRRVQANDTVAIYVRSIDEKLKIEAHIGLVSIIKQNKGG